MKKVLRMALVVVLGLMASGIANADGQSGGVLPPRVCSSC